MANIAIRDADIIVALANWGPGHFDIVYHGKNYEAWRQDAAMAIIENPDLRQAMTTADGKMSLIRALQRSASTGLSLNPQKGESALVPIQGKINFWPMKNGMIKEALATGSLEFVESNTIFANDEFKIKKTAKGDDYEFSPALKERGPSVAYFAVAALKSGRTVVVYMPREQVEEHAKKYGKGMNRQGSAWNSNFDGMAEKTVLKHLLSRLHLPTVDTLITIDDQTEQAQEPERNVTPEKGTDADALSEKLAEKAAETAEADAQVAEPSDAELAEESAKGLF